MNVYGVELIEDGDMVCRMFHKDGAFEPDSIGVWGKHCYGTVVDVGAYTGLYAIFAAKFGANVVAIEPHREVFIRLNDNVKANDAAVRMIHCAAGKEFGVCSLDTEGRPKLTSGSQVKPGSEIPVIPIDALQLDNVSAMKIDVEGAEADAIKGAMETIKGNRPVIIAESWNAESDAVLDKLMSDIQYKVTPLDGRNRFYEPIA